MTAEDTLNFAAAPNCPVDLHTMELAAPTGLPVWECPVCGLRRAPADTPDGWWTTLSLPGRSGQPLVLEEGAKGVVWVKFNRHDLASGPWANWREAEQAARAWLEEHS